ncbi:MAG TPA: class A beta-lactamase-related serine hydrolase [Pyrinomonadaceae bacterium]|nr:class A beta-lactamase-related serine hydrolase [Pyrinomonadaceae bacterium]
MSDNKILFKAAMQKIPILVLMLAVGMTFGCVKMPEIPDGFPTPEPPPSATPVPKMEYKQDAELEKQIADIAAAAKGKVGVAAVVLETGEAAFLNADGHYPMQSVYKLPIAMAVMEQVRLGKLDLDEVIGVTKSDMVREGMRSPLRDKSPNGGEYTIRELIRLALVESDGTASDVLMRVAGGAGEIQSYLTQIGIRDMKVVNTEKEIGKDWQTQYENWSTPMASADLLRRLYEVDRQSLLATPTPERPVPGVACNCPIPEVSYPEPVVIRILMRQMAASVPGEKRLKGLLPPNTVVAHKTGTGGTQNGITGATNDIGIISLPNGKNLAIAVFVSDSPADEKTREAVIAKIAKACWDRWNKN